MILPSQALHQHRRHCLPCVSHDFALLGANFVRIGVYFASDYPRPLHSRVGGIGFFSCSRVAAPLRRVQSSVMPLKHRKAAVTLTQTKKPAPGMLDHAGRPEHQLRHHRLDAPALGAVAHRRIGLIQSVLPNQTQQVHRHRRQLAHQVVGVKLATSRRSRSMSVLNSE